jgi:hypothetical protein
VELDYYSGEWEAYYVEVAAFDARDVAAGAALDGVGAGFVVGLVGVEVAGDFFLRQLGEMDKCAFDKLAALHFGMTKKRYAGDDGMCAAGKSFEHVAGFVAVAGFAQDLAVEDYDRIRGKDDRGTDGARGDELAFGVGEALDVLLGSFTRDRRLVDSGGEHGERESGIAENLGAARGRGREDQLHGVPREKNTIGFAMRQLCGGTEAGQRI